MFPEFSSFEDSLNFTNCSKELDFLGIFGKAT